MVESKLSPCSGSVAFRQLNSIVDKRHLFYGKNCLPTSRWIIIQTSMNSYDQKTCKNLYFKNSVIVTINLNYGKNTWTRNITYIRCKTYLGHILDLLNMTITYKKIKFSKKWINSPYSDSVCQFSPCFFLLFLHFAVNSNPCPCSAGSRCFGAYHFPIFHEFS